MPIVSPGFRYGGMVIIIVLNMYKQKDTQGLVNNEAIAIKLFQVQMVMVGKHLPVCVL